ncbi:MAG: tol-pal system protein YbgF [Pseudomonadota bacterium]|jgi:tol-pal system protein YbgF
MKRLICLGLLAAAPFAHAGIFDDDEARKAILDLRKEARDGDIKLEKSLADANARIDAQQRSSLELSNQIQLLREEIAKLRGALEVQTNELAGQQRRNKDLYGDLDARLKVLEPRKVSVDGREASVERTEEIAYNAALDLFKSGDMKGAQAGFASFLQRYPSGGYAPLATYWMGASQYGNKDFKGAQSTLSGFVQRFPDSPRVPDAWLTIANAQLDGGDKRTANRTLGKIINDFPGTSAAQQARERLPATR